MSAEPLHPFDEIFRDESYRYWFRGEQLWSISQMMRLTGIKKSHHGIAPEVLEWAGRRGDAIEAILFALLRGEKARIEVPNWTRKGATLEQDVLDRVPAIQSFLANERPEYVTHHQIVADIECGVAGELDLVLRTHEGVLTVADCKATSRIEKDWPLQLGFLLAGWEEKSGERAEPAVVHFQTSLKRGYAFRKYPREQCLGAWQAVRGAWMESRALFSQAREAVEGMMK